MFTSFLLFNFSLFCNLESFKILLLIFNNLSDSSTIIPIYSFFSSSVKSASSSNCAKPFIELIGVFISCDMLFIKSFCNTSIFPKSFTITLKFLVSSPISSSLWVSSCTSKLPAATFCIAPFIWLIGFNIFLALYLIITTININVVPIDIAILRLTIDTTCVELMLSPVSAEFSNFFSIALFTLK